MPFYTKLKIKSDDTLASKKKKRRVATKLRLLQDKLREHLKTRVELRTNFAEEYLEQIADS